MNIKPYYSANDYYRSLFGEKAYKISLNAGMTCPNRDGTCGIGGCIFCSDAGSGDFAADYDSSISAQIDAAISRISPKYHGSSYIAYFQAFTNTYAPIDRLRDIFTTTINDKRIKGISIATRPDCLEPEKISLIAELNKIKPVWVELGLQTTNEDSARYIRRGYSLNVFEDAVKRMREANIKVIAHMIVGLPGETHYDYMNTARYIAGMGIHGIKIQLLHVLKHTDLAKEYEKGLFHVTGRNEYVKTVVDIVETLPSCMVVYRITGDGPRNLLLAPRWSTDKKNIINMINREFILRNTYQGKEYKNGC